MSRVCRRVKDHSAESSVLQVKLFLRPTPTRETWALCYNSTLVFGQQAKDLQDSALGHYPRAPRPLNLLSCNPELLHPTNAGATWRAHSWLNDNMHWLAQLRSFKSHDSRGIDVDVAVHTGSRRMYLSQQPATEAVVVICDRGGYKYLDRRDDLPEEYEWADIVVHDDDGITYGAVIDAIHAKVGKKPRREWRAYLHFGDGLAVSAEELDSLYNGEEPRC